METYKIENKIDMKTLQKIYDLCSDALEKHEELAGRSFRAEEALALFRYALESHHSGYGYGGAVQKAHQKIFQSTIEIRPVKL